MDSLSQAVVSTLAYYRLFDFPLTKFEIFKFLHQPRISTSAGFAVTNVAEVVLRGQSRLKNIDRPYLKKVFEAIDDLFGKGLIYEENGFYFLDKEKNYVFLRLKRQKIAIGKWRQAKKIINFLQILPFVRMLGITGSLSIANTTPQSDLDLLIIASPKRIWTTRFLTSVFLYVLGKKRHNQKIASRACLNTFVSQGSLEMAHQDLYSGHEYVQLIPVLGINAYKDFLRQNTWIKKYFYHLNLNIYHFFLIKRNKIFEKTAGLIEYILAGKIGNIIEKTLSYFQKMKIKNNIKGEIVFEDTCLIFHPQPKSQWVDKNLKLRI